MMLLSSSANYPTLGVPATLVAEAVWRLKPPV